MVIGKSLNFSPEYVAVLLKADLSVPNVSIPYHKTIDKTRIPNGPPAPNGRGNPNRARVADTMNGETTGFRSKIRGEKISDVEVNYGGDGYAESG